MSFVRPRQPSPRSAEPAPPGPQSTPVVVHLSGRRRGTTQRLVGVRLVLGKGSEADLRVSPEPCVADRHAVLELDQGTYRLRVEPGQRVWVNGEEVNERRLRSGDLLEIGPDGPVLRYRLYPPGSRPAKSPAEALADSLDVARLSSEGPLSQATLLMSGALKEFATQTSLWFRVMAVMLILLMVGTALLTRRSLRLEQRLEQEELRVSGLSRLAQESRLDRRELAGLVQLRQELDQAMERVDALETRSGATVRVVGLASRSVVLLQGAYGFVEPGGGQLLRYLGFAPDGRPLSDERGEPIVGTGGDGPPVEAYFTGTAFLIADGGLLLTNRHVALPWDYDPAARAVVAQGLEPQMRRFIGYLPGRTEPVKVALVQASDRADLAILSAPELSQAEAPLELSPVSLSSGDEVIVLGYPAGIRALLARADPQLVEELKRDRELDFWKVTRKLAEAGHIAPLASRGIVAQVTSAAVVYDAETTRGGSGGPVLDLSGKVVAVTSAVVSEFGGSNIGVPAPAARRLLQGSTAEDPSPPTATRTARPGEPEISGPGPPDQETPQQEDP